MKRFSSLFPPGQPLPGAAWLLVMLLLFGLPLLVVGAATDSFLLPKQVVFQCGVVLLTALATAAAFFGRGVVLHLQPSNGFAILFLLWSAASIGWSQSRDLAIAELCRLTFLVGFSILIQSFCTTRKHLLLAAYALGASSLVVAILTVVMDFRRAFASGGVPVRQVLGDWRDVISTVSLGNTSHLGDFLVFGFLLWLGTLLVTRTRWLGAVAIVSLILHAAALIISWSVHSNLSLIVASGFALFLLRDYGVVDVIRRMKARVGTLVIGFALVVGFFVIDHPLNPHGSNVWKGARKDAHGGIFSEAFGSSRWTSGLDTRYAIWLTTLEMVRENPWLGHGAGNFVYVYPATISPLVMSNPKLAPYGASWTNAAHNEILQTWSELGIVGLALLILMIGTAMKAYWDRLHDGTSFGNAVILAIGLSALIAMCVQMQMNFPLRLPISAMLFFLLLAVPHLVPSGAQDEPQVVVPVERTWGGLTAEVSMKNMSHPTTLSLVFSIPRSAGLGLGFVVIAAGLLAFIPLSRPLRADIAYREIYEAQFDPRQRSPAREALFPRCLRVLEIWPGHVDCRSRYQEMLLIEGRFARVLEQTPLVLRKLNAIEVYQRRALALEALGRSTEAVPDWDEIFRRQPLRGQGFPDQFRAWVARRQQEPPSAD
ncbi:O-antigen ligase family protein [Candidatus Sumerlaeota bacterium]|nr:O-antigen ligase family protein [Candidatus Sumerlaeota bacterium]